MTLTNVLVDGFSGTANSTDTNGVIEVALDIEMAIAMATSLSRVIILEAQNNGITPLDVLNPNCEAGPSVAATPRRRKG